MNSNVETRKWVEADVPDQSGRVVVVTGSNTGIGYHTAAVLAYRGAHVVLAVRNLEKGNTALSRIVAASPGTDFLLPRNLIPPEALATHEVREAAQDRVFLISKQPNQETWTGPRWSCRM